jgi:hypothetical protein
VNQLRHLSYARDVAIAGDGRRDGLDATVHLTHCHLATITPSTPRIDSPRRFHPSPTVHAALAMPLQRVGDAQSAQSARPFPCTPLASSLALHARWHDIEPTSRRHPRPAQPITDTFPQPTVSPATPLKPLVPRVNQPATDTVYLSPRLGALYRPQTPPSSSNRVR